MPARKLSLVWLSVMCSVTFAIVLGAVLFAPAPVLYAAMLPVTTCNASDLIAAINTANLDAAADTITLTAECTYTFSLPNNYWYGPNALPPISSTITIEGSGATLINAAPTRLRFFYVGANPASARTPGYNTPGAGRLTLHNLTLTGGIARGGDSQWGGGGAGMGGAIFNQGELVLDQVTLHGNSARGGGSFLGTTLFGGGGMGADASGNLGGGFGGAVSPAGSVGGNGVGGGGGFRPGDNGGYVNGGGIPDGLGGRSHDDIGIDGNGSGGGSANAGGGDFGHGGDYFGGGGVGGGGGRGGNGGGFGGGGGYNGSGKGSFGGFGGGGGSGTPGNSGGGGGFGGGAGGSGGPSGGGGAGMGGAIFNHGGVLTLTNSTLANNIAQGGPTDGNDSGGSGSGLGGALFNLNGRVSIFNSTFAANAVAAGSGGTSGSAAGGALYSLRYTLNTSIPNADVTLSNTILANSVGGNDLVNDRPSNMVAAAGGITNTGAATMLFAAPNLVESRINSGGVITDTFTLMEGIDPLLAPVGDYGGGTQTLALLPGSPAIDAGAGCPITDQRGESRPHGSACDLGAFESQGFTLTKVSGDNQTTPVNTAFAQPLAISVTSAYSEPVNGGVVTFAGPFSGAGINPITTTATITNGAVAHGLTANGILGSFTIEASANGAAPITFTLKNLACVYLPLVAK